MMQWQWEGVGGGGGKVDFFDRPDGCYIVKGIIRWWGGWKVVKWCCGEVLK